MHGADSGISSTWSMHGTALSEAEMDIHSHLSNHVWPCMGSTWRPNHQMWLKGDSGDRSVRSYEVPSDVQGEAGYACDGRTEPS